MGIKRFLLLLLTLTLATLPLKAASDDNTENMSEKNLKELLIALRDDYLLREPDHQQFMEEYGFARDALLDLIQKNDDLPLLLYNQDPEFTFSLSWILKEVTSRYQEFSMLRSNDDRFIDNLVVEIDRYDRLIESLESRQVSPDLEACRDSCIAYASGLRYFHKFLMDTITADQRVYQDAVQRMKVANEYVQGRFDKLQKYIFREGQTPWSFIFAHPKNFMMKVKSDFALQYSTDDLKARLANETQNVDAEWNSNRSEHTLLMFGGFFILFQLLILCIIGILLAQLISRLTQYGRNLGKTQKYLAGVLLGCIFSIILYYFKKPVSDFFIQTSIQMIHQYVWLLTIILAALLSRVKPDQLKACFRLYLPSIGLALIIIICRIIFMPDSLLTLLLAPVLIMVCIRQALVCYYYRERVDRIDLVFGWVSFGVALVALVVAILGFTFAAMLILTWWYIQLAILLAILSFSFLLQRYKEKRMTPRIAKYHAKMARVTGLDMKSLRFGFTWFYDLVSGVIMPVLALLSIPFCLQLTLNVFNFDKIFHTFYYEPFIHLTEKDGTDVLLISLNIIIVLACLFFVFLYLNKLIHYLWQSYRYAVFRRKNHRMTARANELNLSLGNSVISVLVWLIYIAIAVVRLRIPIGSLGLIAGGFSAGVGLALKDTINNFIYGIQLMSGRMRVGDYIECDGVRGKVSDISYQYTELDTLDGNSIIFTNSTLFNKNFKNLTRGNSYEYLKIPVTVSYEADIEQVRKVLLEAMKPLQKKDPYDRPIVDPKHGVTVGILNMADNGVELGIKQYVLAEQRNSYLSKAAEVLYKALTDNHIEIPNQQLDIRLFQNA